MTSHDLDTLTTRALADLDAAPPSTLTPEQVARADAALAGILASDRDTTALPLPRPTRRVTARRVAIVGVLAAACTTGVVALQVLTGGESASASWTAAPHTPTTPEQAAAGDACRDELLGTLRGGSGGDPTGVTAATIRSAGVVLAEQRGSWTMVVLGDGAGFDGSCITRDGPLFSRGMFGSMGIGPADDPGPRDLQVTSRGTGIDGDEAVSVLTGLVGAHVRAVTIHTAEHGDVVATVVGGHVAAWWPGSASAPVVDEVPDVTITYTDGTSTTRSLRSW